MGGGTGTVEPLSEEVVGEMKLALAAMRRVDADSDGSISFKEFCTAMAPMYSQNTQMLRRAFRFFDADNSGFIDRQELSSMLSKLRLAPPSEAALEAAFQAADTNGDNQISPNPNPNPNTHPSQATTRSASQSSFTSSRPPPT